MTGSGTLVSAYQRVAGWYLVALLYVYPYGISFGDEASLRLSDLFALLAVAMGVDGVGVGEGIGYYDTDERGEMVYGLAP